MTAPIAPGVVTSLDPFMVQLGADGVAQPCQRVAPAQVGQRGGVLILGGQRVWLGAYDKSDVDLSGLVARLDPTRWPPRISTSGSVPTTRATSTCPGSWHDSPPSNARRPAR